MDWAVCLCGSDGEKGREQVNYRSMLGVALLLTIVGIALWLGGCGDDDEIAIFGLRDPDDMDADFEEYSTRMRSSENSKRSAWQARDEDYIGDDWTVRTFVGLAAYRGGPWSYIMLATDTVDGEEQISVAEVQTSVSTIVSRGRFQIFGAGSNTYGDEHSPVVAVTFVTTGGSVTPPIDTFSVVAGWVQDPSVAEFSIRFSSGHTVDLSVPEHRYFVGVLERFKRASRWEWTLPVVEDIVARDSAGQIIR